MQEQFDEHSKPPEAILNLFVSLECVCRSVAGCHISNWTEKMLHLAKPFIHPLAHYNSPTTHTLTLFSNSMGSRYFISQSPVPDWSRPSMGFTLDGAPSHWSETDRQTIPLPGGMGYSDPHLRQALSIILPSLGLHSTSAKK